MNDRFKFRVWSKQSNSYIKEKMFYIDKFGGLFKYEKSKSTVYINADSPYIMCLCGDKYICEQCTSLKDKNGKLIYEGDILEVMVFDKKNIHQKKKTYWSVEYKDHANYDGFMVYGINRRWNAPITRNRLYSSQVIIVGNIHKNADLIKVGGK